MAKKNKSKPKSAAERSITIVSKNIINSRNQRKEVKDSAKRRLRGGN